MAAVPPQIPGLVDWRPLARGGFATVWEAKQLSLNRLVAVKVDRRTLETDSEQRRFLREAGAAGRMSGHPGIVTVHDAGILTDDRPYLVMALCEGGSLTKWVKGEPRPSQEEVRDVGVRIADALAATHARGVLHRDVKPANILIDSYGHAGLADFGLAALPDPGMELNETLEAITPAYAPPEVFHRKPPTKAGDVYSLGATLYAMLSGRPPRWPDTGTPNIVAMFERLGEPIDRIPGVDDDFMDVLLAALASEPEDRPSATEFRDQLKALPLGAPAVNGQAVNGHSAAALTSADVTADVAEADSPPADGRVDQPEREVEPASTPPGGTEPPERLTDAGDGRRRSRRRTGLLAAALTVFLAIVLGVTLAYTLPGRNAVTPTTAPATTVPVPPRASPSPEPTPESTPTPSPEASQSLEPGALPPGVEDCSDLGANVYCATQPECWGGVRSFADAPGLSDPVDCYQEHVYQTFAVGRLDIFPRRQSTLEDVPEVKATCTQAVANSRLANEADWRDDWKVLSLPPQAETEDFFRCIFGGDTRTTPIALKG